MTVSMITCPSCRTLLLNDTVVCPACQHVLDADRAALLGDAEDLTLSPSQQIVCRSCGESNQIGLVRCWNCSSFLREDIQEAYYEMLRSERRSTYRPPSFMTEAKSGQAGSPGDQVSDADGDDDFELSEAYSLSAPPAKTPAPPAAPTNGSSAKTPHPPEAQKTPEPSPEQKRPTDEEVTESHSVATGGDVLLDIALKEEKESVGKPSSKKREKDQAGKEPMTPERLAAQKKALARKKAARKKAERKFGVWLEDVHQHAINPQKLKLKPGSMEKLFEPMDVGFSAEGIIVLSIAKKGGLFGKSKTTPEETRKEIRDHLEAGKKKEDLPASKHRLYEPESLSQIKVVQPVVYVHESMFAGIPVFGEGRIAVRLPIIPESAEQQFLTFWLTEFRKFAAAMEKYYQIKDLGVLESVPLTDPILDLKCHYSEAPVKAIDPEVLTFYQKDPSIKLELAGRKCEGCGLVVSEEARRKEKIGGLNGKSIAKAKCPKCEKKFGNISLFKIEEPPPPPPEDPRIIKK